MTIPRPQDTDPLRDRDTDRELYADWPPAIAERQREIDGYLERYYATGRWDWELPIARQRFAGWHQPRPWHRRIPRSLAAWWRRR